MDIFYNKKERTMGVEVNGAIDYIKKAIKIEEMARTLTGNPIAMYLSREGLIIFRDEKLKDLMFQSIDRAKKFEAEIKTVTLKEYCETNNLNLEKTRKDCAAGLIDGARKEKNRWVVDIKENN